MLSCLFHTNFIYDKVFKTRKFSLNSHIVYCLCSCLCCFYYLVDDLIFFQFQEDRAILLSNKAAANLKMGLQEKALENCSEAIELNPNYVKAILRRAQTYEDTDKPHEALKDFEKVLELDPGNKDARMAVMVSY